MDEILRICAFWIGHRCCVSVVHGQWRVAVLCIGLFWLKGIQFIEQCREMKDYVGSDVALMNNTWVEECSKVEYGELN